MESTVTHTAQMMGTHTIIVGCQVVQRRRDIRITIAECQVVHRLESTATEETAGVIISPVIIEG